LKDSSQLFQLSKLYHINDNDLEIFYSIHDRILKKGKIPDDEIFPFLLRITQNSMISENSATDNNYHLTQKAILLMKKHLKTPITIKALSDILDVSTRTLELTFNKHFHLSPKCYYKRLLYLDVEKEIRMRDPEKVNISDILCKYEMYDLSYFGKSFKEYFDTKPSKINNNNPLGWNERVFMDFLGENLS